MFHLNQRLFGRHLEDDEVIAHVVHKHWFRGFRFLFWPALSFAACWILLFLAPSRGVFYAVSLWSMVSVVWFLRNFFDYYLDAWIITNMGIIDVEWHGWFHRESARILYSDIQGVSYEIQGVSNTLLRYGNVSVEKISTGKLLSLENVPNPRRVEGIILQNMEEYLHAKNLKNAKNVQEIFSTIVAREVQRRELEKEGSGAASSGKA